MKMHTMIDIQIHIFCESMSKNVYKTVMSNNNTYVYSFLII